MNILYPVNPPPSLPLPLSLPLCFINPAKCNYINTSDFLYYYIMHIVQKRELYYVRMYVLFMARDSFSEVIEAGVMKR